MSNTDALFSVEQITDDFFMLLMNMQNMLLGEICERISRWRKSLDASMKPPPRGCWIPKRQCISSDISLCRDCSKIN